MAKHVILEAYTFTPLTKTIVITGKNIRREQMLLITNTTTGTVLYNFSDPALGVTSYVNAVDSATGQETTTLVLASSTAAMALTDKISILTEETYQEIIPAEVMRDPVDKLRVSTPQSLIDTDFEYGSQPTKWEGLNLLNNRPSAFYDVTIPLGFTGISATGKLVTVLTTSAPAVGTPIFVQGTLDDANAGGWWIVETSSGSQFQYSVTVTPSATLYDATKSYVYVGSFFSGAVIPSATGAFTFSGTTITVQTTNGHGLRVGDGIYVIGTTATTFPPNGSWAVATTPTTNTFTFIANNAPTGTIGGVLNGSVYPRSLGYVQHRAFDGGVQFTNVSPNHGYQVIRQTRRQFRYQSGKAIQFSTGSIMKPALNIDGITSSGTTVTITSKFPHGMALGARIQVSGCIETAYNGTFTVTGAPTPLTLTYTALSTPSATIASGFPLTVSPFAWYGSSNKIGLFDQQNGIFFEFDGQNIYCVKRNSTTQISGVVAVAVSSNSIIGTNTKFSSQLKPGDYIVIRGMSYLIQSITSDTQMHIYPEYRGVTSSNCTVSKTIDTRYAQSVWNIDKLDGTGSSLYNLDLTKMQMFYIDFTWYGAGAVRFGFKNNRGEIVYCHRIPNNNVNTEAYMRSGNLVARYETSTVPAKAYLTATLASGTTSSMTVNDTSLFPPSGILVIMQAGDTGGVIEYIKYANKTANTFTGLTRNDTGGNAALTTFTYSATAPISVEMYSTQMASTISHWGSSVIMDGRYDNDRSIEFNYGQNAPVTYPTAGTRYPVLSIRLAPSVDNGQTGLLGTREIINRMQMQPVGCGVYPTGAGVKIDFFLNGRITGSSGGYVPVGGSSLAQAAIHGTGATITGGESIYTFFAPAGGVTTADISQLRDLGTSILGGGTLSSVSSTAANVYPDGPDILTVCVTPLTANAATVTRISWSEAQA